VNDSEHLEDELSSEVSTAKTGVSLAVSALTGNYIEAAMKLAAQPKESSRGLLFLVFCIFMIFVLLIYCIPVTIYEGLESVKNNWSSFSTDIKEAWNRGMYAGGGNLWERWKQALKEGTKELQSQFLNRINQNASAGDKVSQNDLGVLFSKDDYKEVLVRKMNAAGEKLDARSREIYEAISSSDVLQSAFRERFLREYGQFQGYDDVSYDGVVVSWRSNSSYGRDAIRMMSLYTVMKQGSGEEYKVSGFMRWLGWKDSAGDFMYDISGNVTYFDELWAYDQSEAESSYMNPYTRKQQNVGYYDARYHSLGYYANQADVFNSVAYLGSMNTGHLAAGDIKYEDANGDGQITEADYRRVGKSGVPRCQYGISLNFGFRGWYLNTLFQGSSSFDKEISGTNTMKTDQVGSLTTIYPYQKDTWTTGNTSAAYPRLMYNTNSNANNNYLNAILS